MTEIDVISARLTVLETVMRQLITHMAVRADDPPQWVQTRKSLAVSAIAQQGQRDPALLQEAVTAFFDQAELVASEYAFPGKAGTPHGVLR